MLHALRSFQIQGKIPAAKENFARILTANPGHFHARIGLGYCAWLTGDRISAKQILNDAAALDLPNEEAVLDCTAALAHVGEHKSADALLDRWPQTSRLLAARGAIAEQKGDVDHAIIFYERIFAEDLTPSEANFHRLTFLYRRAGRFEAALALVGLLEAAYPDRKAAAAHSRGQIFLAMGRGGDAMVAFEGGLAADPHGEACLLALGREWRRFGRYDEAEALLTSGPQTAPVLLSRSDLALACRDADVARRHAEAADRLLPKGPEALLRLCQIEIDQGCYAAAHTVADRILGKGADCRIHHLRALIDIARATENDLETKRLLTQLVTLQPMDAAVRVDLSRAWRKLGEGDEAAAELSRALDCDPRSVAALGEAGDQAQRDRDYPTALGFFRKAVEIMPEYIHHHLRLARLLQVMDSNEQAAVLETIAARFGDATELRGDHIRRLRDAGLLEEALAAATAALAVYPGVFGLWIDCINLTLRLRPASTAADLLARAPAQNRREEIALASQRALLAIRLHRRDEARRILEETLARDPNNRSCLSDLFLLSLWRSDLPEAIKIHLRLAKLYEPERRLLGETANPSQSHNGQIVNDMRLDSKAMAALGQARGGTSRGQVRRLLELVRERPDHIPTAQALVVTLTETRRFGAPPLGMVSPTAHSHIPPRIAQYWDEDVPPADLRAYAESWRAINPGYTYQLFSDKTARVYLRERLPAAALQAYLRAQDATTRADLFRLAVLTQDGGIWSDMDDRCQRPVGQLFRPADRAVFWQERSGHLCNNFMAAAPNHPILRRALVTAVDAINRGDNDKVWMLTGPGLITRCFALEMAAAGEAWPSWLEQVNVIDEFDLWPVVAMHCMAVYKRQGRHWHKEAFEKTIKRNVAGLALAGQQPEFEQAPSDFQNVT